MNTRSNYATGFSLLNSVLDKGFNLPELHELMSTTAKLSITSYYEDVRLSARKVILIWWSSASRNGGSKILLEEGRKFFSNSYAWFTFSSRQHETGREQECEEYIRLIFHTLYLFSSRLEALGDMLVNQSRVKGNENVSKVLLRYRRFSHESVNIYIRVYFVSFTSRQKSRRVPEMRM